MAKQLNVNLAFTADTSQAKAQIQELQNALNNIHKAPAREDAIFDGRNIREASQAALELSQHLQKAVNVDTGRLDLARFSSSLKASGKTLDSYYETLLRIGPEGQQAFLGLATAIAQAEAPVVRVNARLSEMWTTMKNTARWQLSSSMLHGFMGTLQSAYGYAQDLNESLNNIRIVSGQSTDQMAKFAKEANKSAKALSTTTTEYTNASLIYYQQGLSDQEVKERTDITIKMANAAGVSAEHVSDQLTAVWNNFAKGGENLEYYADVMTALGAATASSTDEIAAGLEKFAAIADTVGLSYEYSTAALATITANTRQSADVVGNALKTLFARIQGLSLGETLEDGVDLNKYSSALAAVGVQVLDANGQLRDMDDILDDLAAKWDTIGKAEQTALAQTVAGVRQYTQLVALMENWDDMERNLDVAYNSTGTLQTQADIYAESWEAASDRVRAAAEGIFDSLINDEFFIGLLNGFEKVLTGVEGLIDGFGGLKGIASITGAILLKQFSKELPTTFRNIKENFMVISGQSDKLMDQMQKKSIERIRVQSAGTTDPVFRAQLAQQERMTLMQNKLLLKSREMSTEEQQQYQAKIERYKMASDAAIDLAKQEEEAEAKVQEARKETKKQSQESKDIQRAFDIETEIAKKEKKIDTLLLKDGLLESEKKVLNKEEEELVSLQAERQAIYDKYQEYEITDEGKFDVGARGLAEQNFEEKIFEPFEKQVRAKASFDFSKSGLESYKNLFDRINPEDAESFKRYKKDLELYANTELERLQLSSDAYEEIFDEKTGQRKIQKKKNAKGEDIEVSDENLRNSIASMEALRDAAHNTSTTAQQLGEAFANATKDIEKGSKDAATEVKRLGEEVDKATESGTAENLEGVITTAQNTSNRQAFQEAQSRQMADEEPAPASATTEEIVGDFSAYAMSVFGAIESTKAFISIVEEGGSAMEVFGALIGMVASFSTAWTMATTASSVAMANNTIATVLNTKAQSMRNIVTGKALTGQLLLNAALIGGAIALAAGLAILDAVWTSHSEAAQAISEANSLYQEESQKLADLKSELTDIQAKINEINSNPLTLVDANELNKLKTLEQSLKNQIAVQEQVTKDAELASLQTMDENFNAFTRKARWWDRSKDTQEQWRIKNASTLQQAENMYSQLVAADQAGTYNYARKIAHQDQLKALRQNMFDDETYAKQFLVPLVKELGGKINQSDLDNYEKVNWAEKVGQESLDKMGIAADDFNNYFIGVLDSVKNFSPEFFDQIDELSLDELVVLFENIGGIAQLAGTALTKIQEWLNPFIDKKRDVSGDEFASRYSDIQDIIKDLEFGDTISSSDFTTLNKDDAYSDYFVKMADGTYKLIAAADEFNTIVKNTELQGIKDSIQYSQNKIYNENGENKIFEKTGIKEAGTMYSVAQYRSDNPEFSSLEQMAPMQEMVGFTDEYLQSEYKTDSERVKAIADEYIRIYEDLISKETAAAMTATTMHELNELNLSTLEAQSAGLLQVASQYEECSDEIIDYNAAVKKYGKESEQARKATSKLRKEVSRMEWNKLSEEAYDYAKALVKATKPKDVEKNLKGIQKVIRESFGMDVPLEMLEKYQDDFKKWAKATPEEANDILAATMRKILFEDATGGEDFELPLEIQTDGVTTAFQNVENAYSVIQSILGQPLTVDAQGNADFSSIISGLQAAGFTAEQTAAIIAKVAETDVTIEGGGVEIGSYDLSTPEGIKAFSSAISNWSADMKATGIAAGENVGGGGGGGGGGGAKTPEKPKEYDKERYYTIKRQIENLGREYDQLSEKTDRAFGKDKLDLMDQQIAKIDERIAAQKELIAETEAYLALDKENMVNSYNELFGGKGPQFEYDENGVITNFDEIQDYIYENYLIAGDEANKDLSDAQKAWLDKYGETLQENAEAVQGLIDLEYEKIDTQLAKIEYEIELRVELSEDDLEYLEYLLGKIEDDAFKAAEAIANMGEQMNSLYEQAAANEKGIHDILANRGVSDEDIAKFIAGDISVVENIDFSEAEIEQLRNYRNGLLENAEAMEELRKSIEEKLMEVFDAWIEKLDQGIERVEFFGSVLESYGNIIDIVGKKTLGITDDFMNNLGEAVVKNAIDNMEALKAEEKAINETLQAAQNELEKARATGDERLIKYWEDQVANLTVEAQEAHEAFLSSWEEALDQAAAVFEAAVEAAVEQFNEAIYSLGGLEGLAADFEKQQELADMYLEDYRKIYELSKLNRDINKSIDDTDNLAAKRKLRDLQEEINALEEAGVEMSEYDLEYLQAKYELRLAEIALEEAQNAKDTVRLQKDNEGNYSYVYTANTDAVDEAQQKYEDALYEMQDLSSNYVDEMSSQIIDATQQMMEELSAIRTADYASEQERDEAYARTEAYWLERIGRMKDELNKSIGNNKKLYDEDWTNYHNATGYKISDTDKFVTNFADSMYGALMGVDSTADLMDIIANATSKLIEDLITANNTFTQNQEEIFNAAETSIADFANDAAGSIEKIGEASKQTTEDVKNMSEEMKTDMNDIIDTIAQFQEEVFPIMDEFISKWETAVAVVNELITAVVDLGDLTGDNVNVSNSSGNNNTSASGNSNTSSNQTNSSSSSSQQSNTNNNSNKINNPGYTGDWSDNTAYANYIQEQINLTKKLLETSTLYQDVETMIEAALDLIDLNARQASMAFGTLTPSGLYDETRTTLQQEVSIVAEFPNVQDHNEIAEALNNLINSASQYANRKL